MDVVRTPRAGPSGSGFEDLTTDLGRDGGRSYIDLCCCWRRRSLLESRAGVYWSASTGQTQVQHREQRFRWSRPERPLSLIILDGTINRPLL